jgi:uncharacterized protein with HEPN domain
LPSEKPIQRLNDILENIDRIIQYTNDHTFELFAQDRLTRDAVERCLLRISEAARKLEGIVDAIAPRQPWSDIRALGNIIRHEYDDIDPAVIWKIVADDLLPLEKAVQSAIKKLERER